MRSEHKWAFAGLAGQRHQSRTRRGADLRNVINYFGQNQVRVAFEAVRFGDRQRQVSDQDIGSRQQLEKAPLSVRQLEIQSDAFFSGIEKLMKSAMLDILPITQ